MREVLTPPTICPILIGRTDHLTSLQQRIEHAKERMGGLLLLSGEAGIGKSRLVVEAKTYASAQGFLLLQGNCFLSDLNYPYAPLLDLWRTFFAHLSPATAHDIDAEKFAQKLFPLLPELVSGPVLPFLPENPEQEKRRLFAVMTNLLIQLARQQPLLLIIEDLHWSDDTSLDFLHALARRSSSEPLLLLITYRSDEAHAPLRSWLAQLDRERLAQEIQLSSFSRNEVDAMLSTIFEQRHTALDMRRFLHGKLLDAIYALTEGNPFFVEEISHCPYCKWQHFLRAWLLELYFSTRDRHPAQCSGCSATTYKTLEPGGQVYPDTGGCRWSTLRFCPSAATHAA